MGIGERPASPKLPTPKRPNIIPSHQSWVVSTSSPPPHVVTLGRLPLWGAIPARRAVIQAIGCAFKTYVLKANICKLVGIQRMRVTHMCKLAIGCAFKTYQTGGDTEDALTCDRGAPFSSSCVGSNDAEACCIARLHAPLYFFSARDGAPCPPLSPKTGRCSHVTYPSDAEICIARLHALFLFFSARDSALCPNGCP